MYYILKGYDYWLSVGTMGASCHYPIRLPKIVRVPEQARKLVEAAKGSRSETLLVVALTTGMRRGELLGLKWQENDLVFCNIYGNFLHPYRLYVMFNKMLEDAGVPRIRFHDLRHSAATILLSMGINIKVVQEILGHSRISMTLDIYSHVLPGMQEDAAEKISRLLY
jgi:integrase